MFPSEPVYTYSYPRLNTYWGGYKVNFFGSRIAFWDEWDNAGLDYGDTLTFTVPGVSPAYGGDNYYYLRPNTLLVAFIAVDGLHDRADLTVPDGFTFYAEATGAVSLFVYWKRISDTIPVADQSLSFTMATRQRKQDFSAYVLVCEDTYVGGTPLVEPTLTESGSGVTAHTPSVTVAHNNFAELHFWYTIHDEQHDFSDTYKVITSQQTGWSGSDIATVSMPNFSWRGTAGFGVYYRYPATGVEIPALEYQLGRLLGGLDSLSQRCGTITFLVKGRVDVS